MNKNANEPLKEKLCATFNRNYSFLVGSGKISLYVALRALEINEGEVILPTFVCPDVFYSVILSGLKPVLCDVNKHDYNINPDSLKNAISKNTKVVIAVHLFGQPANMERICQICKEAKLFLIEDAAQALGGKYKDKILGSFGDMSIFSFGYSKMIDVGGGGALLTDDKNLANNIATEIKKLRSNPIVTNLKHKISTDVFLRWQLSKSTVIRLLKIFPNLFKYEISDRCLRNIFLKLEQLGYLVEKRKENTKIYQERLLHPDIIHPKYTNNQGVFWRYSILLKNKYQRNTILEMAREQGIFVSILYKPLHKEFKFLKEISNQKNLENADFLSERIINLCVDPTVTIDTIYVTCELILATVKCTI